MTSGSPARLQAQVRDVTCGARVRIVEPANLYGCTLGDDCFVGPFVEIQQGVTIGARTKVQSHAFVCELVTIGADCFIGHGVMFTNDLYPTTYRQVKRLPTFVGEGASLGSNATVIGGIRIGRRVVIGAGAVVTVDIPDFSIAVGNPARVVRSFANAAELWGYIESQQQGAAQLRSNPVRRP